MFTACHGSGPTLLVILVIRPMQQHCAIILCSLCSYASLYRNARKSPCSQCAWTFCCQKVPTPRWSSHGCSASSSYLLDPAKLLLETATATAVGSSINPEGVLTLSWVKRSSKTRRLSEDCCIRIIQNIVSEYVHARECKPAGESLDGSGTKYCSWSHP